MLAEEDVVMTEGEEGLFGNNKNGDTVNAALGWMYYFLFMLCTSIFG